MFVRLTAVKNVGISQSWTPNQIFSILKTVAINQAVSNASKAVVR